MSKSYQLPLKSIKTVLENGGVSRDSLDRRQDVSRTVRCSNIVELWRIGDDILVDIHLSVFLIINHKLFIPGSEILRFQGTCSQDHIFPVPHVSRLLYS